MSVTPLHARYIADQSAEHRDQSRFRTFGNVPAPCESLDLTPLLPDLVWRRAAWAYLRAAFNEASNEVLQARAEEMFRVRNEEIQDARP